MTILDFYFGTLDFFRGTLNSGWTVIVYLTKYVTGFLTNHMKSDIG